MPYEDKKARHHQTTQKDISYPEIEFTFSYLCGIRQERLSPCLSQRFDTFYSLNLLEEVMRQGFQEVSEIKPPRNLFTSSGAFVFEG
jgi:hypothetical protein